MTFSFCPKCNSKNIAEIAYGYVIFDEKDRKDFEQEKIVLGGCCVTENDPKLVCNDCLNRW